jgi:predicted nucleic acid-binding protein
MIAADTSSFVAYFQGARDADALAVETAIANGHLCLPAVVVTELLSDYKAGAVIESLITAVPRLDPGVGYWERAGQARRQLLARGYKARLGDALAAQACIDHDIPLIARDSDFRHFAKHCGLVLA